MSYVRDEAGNIWSVGSDGSYTFVSPPRTQTTQQQKRPGIGLGDIAPFAKVGLGALSEDPDVIESPEGSQPGWGNVMQGLGGAYNVYQGLQNDDKLAGGVQTGLGAANVAASLGNQTAASVVPYAGFANSGLNAVNVLKQDDAKASDQAQAISTDIALTVADLYTFGLAHPAYALLGKIPGMDKVLDFVTGDLNPLVWAAKPFNHKSTKQVQQERTQELLEMAKDNPEWQKSVTALREGQGAKDAWTPEVAAKALKDPTSMWGASGILKTFGPDYLQKMSEPQRYSITKYAIDNNLLDPEKGVIDVTDSDKLKAGYDEAIGNKDYEKQYWQWKDSETAKQRAAEAAKPAVPLSSLVNRDSEFEGLEEEGYDDYAASLQKKNRPSLSGIYPY